MRTCFLSAASILVFGLVLLLRAEPDRDGDTIKVRLRLVDERTDKSLAGVIRIFRQGSDKPLSLTGLPDRLRGLAKSDAVAGWYVVTADGVETTLPRASLRLEAVSGLETARTLQEIDLSKKGIAEMSVKLKFLFRPDEQKLVAGNTHLHLRDLTKKEADDYLRTVPAADGLKVLFISYLERHKDDEHYITNRYPLGTLKDFNTTGVLVNNGEEHRHNFGGYGQGYGHVMFLDINRLVKPVSLGPGITNGGNDDQSLLVGIADARK